MNKTMLRRCLEKKESNFLCLAKLSSGEMHLKKTLLLIGPSPSAVDDKKIFSDVMKHSPSIRMPTECQITQWKDQELGFVSSIRWQNIQC